MTTRRDEDKLREVADLHAADHPAVAAQLYADADYLAQLHKAPTNVNGGDVTMIDPNTDERRGRGAAKMQPPTPIASTPIPASPDTP